MKHICKVDDVQVLPVYRPIVALDNNGGLKQQPASKQ